MENSDADRHARAWTCEGRITYVNPAFCADDRLGARASWSAARRPSPTGRTDRDDENDAAAAAGAARPQPGRRHRGARSCARTAALFDARMYVSPLIDAEGPADRLDDLDDRHHRAQAHPRPAVGLARALHHRARRRSTPRCRWLSVQRGAAVRQPARTGCGSAPMPTGHAALVGAEPACPTRPTRDESVDDVDSFGGLPTDRADRGRLRAARDLRAEPLGKWLDVRARYLQLDRRPPGADGDRHRHHARAATPRSRRRQQAERRRSTSRLITMGEMASWWRTS